MLACNLLHTDLMPDVHPDVTQNPVADLGLVFPGYPTRMKGKDINWHLRQRVKETLRINQSSPLSFQVLMNEGCQQSMKCGCQLK